MKDLVFGALVLGREVLTYGSVILMTLLALVFLWKM